MKSLSILQVWHPNDTCYPVMVKDQNNSFLSKEAVIGLSIPHKNGYKLKDVFFTNVYSGEEQLKEMNKGLSCTAHCYQQVTSRVDITL